MKEKPKTKEILIIIEEMNLGGTEGSLLNCNSMNCDKYIYFYENAKFGTLPF